MKYVLIFIKYYKDSVLIFITCCRYKIPNYRNHTLFLLGCDLTKAYGYYISLIGVYICICIITYIYVFDTYYIGLSITTYQGTLY